MKDISGWKLYHVAYEDTVRFEMVTDEREPLHICLDMSYDEAREFAMCILHDVRDDDDPRLGLPLKGEPIWPSMLILAALVWFLVVLPVLILR